MRFALAAGLFLPSRRLCAQIGDLAPPAGDQLIALWISAFSDDSLLTEGEFVLRVDECGRPAAVDPLEAARTEDAITANLGGQVVIGAQGKPRQFCGGTFPFTFRRSGGATSH